jgi:hypothetical protein
VSVAENAAADGLRGGRVPRPPKYLSTASGSVSSACIAISAGERVVGGGVPCWKAERTSTSGASVAASDTPSNIGAIISIGAVVVVVVVGGAIVGGGNSDDGDGSSGADGLAVAACVAAAAACGSGLAVGGAVSISIGTAVVTAVVAEVIAPAVAAAVVTAAAVVAAAASSDGAEVGLVERGLGEGSRVGAADFGAAVAGARVLAAAAGRDVGAAVRNPDGAAVTLTGVGAVEVLVVGVGAMGVGFGLAPNMPQGSSGYTEASNRLATSAG